MPRLHNASLVGRSASKEQPMISFKGGFSPYNCVVSVFLPPIHASFVPIILTPLFWRESGVVPPLYRKIFFEHLRFVNERTSFCCIAHPLQTNSLHSVSTMKVNRGITFDSIVDEDVHSVPIIPNSRSKTFRHSIDSLKSFHDSYVLLDTLFLTPLNFF